MIAPLTLAVDRRQEARDRWNATAWLALEHQQALSLAYRRAGAWTPDLGSDPELIYQREAVAALLHISHDAFAAWLPPSRYLGD